jgi:cytochrome c oxidase subunit II
VDSSLTSPSPDIDPESSPIPAPRSRRRPLALVGVLAAALLLTGCNLPSFGAYHGATTQARTEYHLWQGFFIAGLVVGGFVLLLILWAVFRYRRKSEDIPRQTQYHTLTEITYTVVPIIIVVVLFVFTFLAENKVDALPTPTAKVTVDAFQWGWEFDYPGDVKVIGQTTDAPTMVIPANVNVRIYLKSLDVLHGFYVPEFNFSRYASPGYTTEFDFNVLHPGTYRGQCTQLCGLYHSLMFFNVKAVPMSQYTTWLRTQQAYVKAHPSSVPQLPSGVKSGSTSSNTTTNGSDAYGD